MMGSMVLGLGPEREAQWRKGAVVAEYGALTT
jgi:hypothetical protein